VGWHIAQINVASFRAPRQSPVNAAFEAALDVVNATAEASPGFVWRMLGEGENVYGTLFADPHITIYMTVWQTIVHLTAFDYRNQIHRSVMRRRREGFVELPAYLALWWIPAGALPTLNEGKAKLDLIARIGPSPAAFDFKTVFPPP